MHAYQHRESGMESVGCRFSYTLEVIDALILLEEVTHQTLRTDISATPCVLSLAVLGAEERLGTSSSKFCMKIPSEKQDILGPAGQSAKSVANYMLISALTAILHLFPRW